MSVQSTYHEWAAKNNFLSMLPQDAKDRKMKADTEKQTRLDPHLQEKKKKVPIIPYTDAIFREAAIEWLVATDQVCLKIIVQI